MHIKRHISFLLACLLLLECHLETVNCSWPLPPHGHKFFYSDMWVGGNHAASGVSFQFVEIQVGADGQKLNLAPSTDGQYMSLVSDACAGCNVPKKYTLSSSAS